MYGAIDWFSVVHVVHLTRHGMYTVFKKVSFINTRWKLKLTDKLITKLYAHLGSIGVIYTAVANSAAFLRAFAEV